MLIQLQGRAYSIDNFYFEHTYGGFMVRRPSYESNLRVYQQIQYPMNWGKRKWLKIAPEQAAFYDNLPKYTCHGWITSKAINDQYHGSQLVISWLVNDVDQKISDLVSDQLVKIDWENEAKDFEY